MSRNKPLLASLAIFILVGTIPLILGQSTEREALSENVSIVEPLPAADKLAMIPKEEPLRNDNGSFRYYSDVSVKTIDSRDELFGLCSVYLVDSSGEDLGWLWISCPTETQELEVYSTLLMSRLYHDSVTVYVDEQYGYINRVTY